MPALSLNGPPPAAVTNQGTTFTDDQQCRAEEREEMCTAVCRRLLAAGLTLAVSEEKRSDRSRRSES